MLRRRQSSALQGRLRKSVPNCEKNEDNMRETFELVEIDPSPGFNGNPIGETYTVVAVSKFCLSLDQYCRNKYNLAPGIGDKAAETKDIWSKFYIIQLSKTVIV